MPPLSIFLAIFLLAVSCGPVRSLVGRWEGKGNVPGLPAIQQTYEFKASGRYTITSEIYKGGKGLIALDEGTYEVRDGTLKVTLLDVEWRAVNASDEAAKRVAQRFKSNKATIMKNVNQARASRLKWIDENTVELTDGTGTTVLKRLG